MGRFWKRYASLLILAGASTISSSSLVAASLISAEDLSITVSWPLMRVPKWSHGAWINVQNHNSVNPVIWVVSPNGQRTLPFTIPGAQSMIIFDWDLDPDGTVALAGSAADSSGRVGTFLAWISADQTVTQVIRTSPYRPAMVAFASDGTLWTVGTEYETLPEGSHGVPSLVPNAGVIRHFDRSGKSLGAFIAQSTVRRTLSLSRSRQTLRASKDRIAWYSEDERYVEISSAGNLITDIALPLPDGQPMNANTGFGLTDFDDAFLNVSYALQSGGSNARKVTGVYILDRSAQAWKPVPILGQSASGSQLAFRHLCGVDDDRVATCSGKLVSFYKIGK